MSRHLATAAWALTGSFSVLALADRWGWTDPVWAHVCPRIVLPRRPSPAEVHAGRLEADWAAMRRQIAETNDALDASGQQRNNLRLLLRRRLAGRGQAEAESAALQADDPVAFILVRAIDAEERRQVEQRRTLDDLEKQVDSLEARRIAAIHGVSLADTVAPSPSDGLRADAAEDRYRRIIREALDADEGDATP